MTESAVVFWVSLAAVAYAYLGYPVLVWCFARMWGAPSEPPPCDDYTPKVSVLVAAYNEESVIGGRIRNLLALDYPADALEIVVASDGSCDGTEAIVRSFANPRVRLLRFERRGKAAVLNAAFSQLDGEVVLLSDANTHLDADSVGRVVRWFKDPNVGVVCGRLTLTDPATGSNVDGMYWRYETFLKQCESRLGALLGANGGIYAIHRSLFAGIRDDTIVDDFVIPLVSKLRTGCEIVYERTAVAHETTPAELSAEFRRRSRIGAGGFQSIVMLWRLLDPRHGWIAFTFLSHKLLRWLCPFFLVAMLVSNLLLAQQPLYLATLVLQCALYVMALAGRHGRGDSTAARLARVPTMFAGMNAALLVGFWLWISGTQRGTWQRTAR